MVKLIIKHTELDCLTWDFAEFTRLLKAGEFQRPEVYQPFLRVKFFGFKIDISLHQVKK